MRGLDIVMDPANDASINEAMEVCAVGNSWIAPLVNRAAPDGK